MIATRRTPQLVCRIDTTPFSFVMVFVALVLLIIAMTTPYPFHTNSGIDLPRVTNTARMQRADREDALVVAIARDGRIFFGPSPVGSDSLSDMIVRRLNQGAERKVYLKADGRANYSSVKEALDAIQAAGIQNVGILVDKRRAPLNSSQ